MLELSSPLSPEECLRRLRAASDPQWKLFGAKPVLGGVHGGMFWGRRRISYGNSLQTVAFARVRASTAGSRIGVHFGLDPFACVLASVWFGFVLLGAVGWMISNLPRLSANGRAVGNWTPLIGSIALLGLAAGLLAFGRWLARDEKAFLTAFLIETTSASQVRQR
jgi:hypothetical protein